MVDTPKRLQIGVQLPTYENEQGNPTRWVALRRMAQVAEELGIDTLWVADHLLYQGNMDRCVGFWEAWTVLSALADATSRVTLGPLVACIPLRQPALLAQMANTLDEISGGRLILGLGSGSERSRTKYPELERFGYSTKHLVSRFEEAIEIIVRLLRQGHLDFEGHYYQIHDCRIQPDGPRPGGLPIWVGGIGPRMLRLATKWADGVNLNFNCTSPEMLKEPFSQLDNYCNSLNRDPGSLVRTGYVFISFAGKKTAMNGRRAKALKGNPEEIACQLHLLHKAGMKHMQCVIDDGQQEVLSFWPYLTMQGLESFAPVIESLRKLEDAEARYSGEGI